MTDAVDLAIALIAAELHADEEFASRFPTAEEVQRERFGEPFRLGLACLSCGGPLHRNLANFPVHSDPDSTCPRAVVYVTEVAQ
jgi:hypothetical protein